MRKRRRESTVFFAWERRRGRVSVFLRRYLREIGLVVLALLACVYVLQAGSRRRKVFATRTAIANILNAVQAYRADHNGECPHTLQDLVTSPSGQGGYLQRVPRDGWGRPFRFQCPGRKHPAIADVTSAGPSGSFEDTDQIE